MEQAAQACGFRTATAYMGTQTTAAGNLPDEEQLRDLGQLASISFGQGSVDRVSCVQVAASINVFANQGRYIEPTFVEGIVNEYSQTVTESLYSPIQRQAFRSDVADSAEMLVSVVENGLGKPAKPLHGGAGGKTGTAQTGRFQEDGEEIMDAWFAGFYPAENPQYTIAVFLDSGTYSSDDAAAVFAKVSTDLGMYLGVEDEY